MPLAVKCRCGKLLQVNEEFAGKRVKCPACGTILAIPTAAAPAKADDPLGLGDLDLSSPALGGRPLPSFPAAPLPAKSYAPPSRGGSSGNVLLWVLLGVGGGLALLAVLVVAGVLLLVGRKTATAVAPPAPAPAVAPAAPVGPGTPAVPAPVPGPAPAAPQPVTPPATPGIPPTTPAPATPAAPTANADTVRWEAQADPPKEPLAWPDQPNLDIPFPAGKDLLYSATPSPFAVVGLNISGGDGVQLWDLVKGQKGGELQASVKDGKIVAVSPDGQYLAAGAADRQHYGKLKLFSFRTGVAVREVECAEPKTHLQTLDFISPTRVVTQAFGSPGKGYRYAISVWDVTTGTQVCEIPAESNYQKGKLDISPGGRYLATMDNDTLLAFDLQAGRLAGKLSLKPALGDSLGALFGMSFAPDGRQLGIVLGSTNSRVVFFDFAAGKVADQIELAGKPPTSSAYKGAAVEWLGDKGWCLFGGTIIDRATRRVVWNLDLPLTDRLTARRTLPGGWIATTGPWRNKRIKFIPLSWDKIQTGLAALAGDATALLKPGQSVSLELTVDKLRFGTPDETKTKLAEIFQERFKADGITVADNQPLVLKVTYGESAGETLVERQGIMGPATGRTVQATKVDVKLVLTPRAGGQAVWQHDLAYDPHAVTVRGKEATDAAVHDAILRQLLYQLSFAPIPYYVPQDKSLSPLPGVTVLSDK